MRPHHETTPPGTSDAVICTLMRRHLVLLIAAIVTLSAAGALADFRDDRRVMTSVDQNPLVRVRGAVEVRAQAGSLTAAQIDEFADLAEKGAGDIAKFTGVELAKQRIVIYLAPSVEMSHTYTGSSRHQPRIFIDSDRVPDHTAPYIHELVHAVVGDGGPMWLEEGFAEWVASSVATKYGGYYAPVMTAANDRIDAQARMAIARSRGAGETRTWFGTEEPQPSSQHERRTFYILAHSFTKFLADTLGTTRLVSIHRADDVQALARVSGVSNEEWERRWLAELGKGEAVAAARSR
jgi:hypothetical protein